MDTMICVDCAIWHTNDDDSGAREGFTPSGSFIVTDADGVDFYVPITPCPSCGTSLAGSWFPATSN